jgi:hypothetical protein
VGDALHPTVVAFLAAAEAGDVDRLEELIDWPTSGVARFVASLRELPERRRPELARQGLAEMFALAAGSGPDRPLGSLAMRLTEDPMAVRLDRSGVEALIQAARPGPLPAAIPDDIAQAVDRLRRRIDTIEEAYRLSAGKRKEAGLGVLSGANHLTLVRRFPAHPAGRAVTTRLSR